MTPEAKVKLWLGNQLEKMYGHLQFWSYAPPGGYFGQNGTADRLLIIPSEKPGDEFYFERFGRPCGVPVAIEVKAEGNELRPLQKRKLEEVHRAGGVAAVLIGKDFEKMRGIFVQIEARREMNRNGWLETIRHVMVKETIEKIEA
jgi:hypothetical protein